MVERYEVEYLATSVKGIRTEAHRLALDLRNEGRPRGEAAAEHLDALLDHLDDAAGAIGEAASLVADLAEERQAV
jgi:hypothetical protein